MGAKDSPVVVWGVIPANDAHGVQVPDNVTVTLINLPPQNLFCDSGLWKGGGGVSIINDGGGGRIGSAARSTSSTSKRKSNKIGIFRAGTIYYCHPFYCNLDLSRPCWAQKLLESEFECTGFCRSGDKMLLPPPLLMLWSH